MTEDARFPGLLEHIEQRLGPVQRVESAKTAAGNRGYDLTFYENDQPPVTTVVTNGLRFQAITSMLPEEIMCSLRSDQQHIAMYLVDSMASLILKNKQGMEYGSVFENSKPLIEGTKITALVGHTNLIHDVGFNLFPGHDAPKLQLITMVPITGYEVDFIKEEGPDMLFEVFRDNRTNILDVQRESAV
ncbi:suppressor of fused domain protein [Nocardia sp. NPDC057668]|uniref:suppressor of fused domain protein n=1 Tax=Nocardia sp. NPDC057668 TaxID=3346202 RepID=UPI00366F5AAE